MKCKVCGAQNEDYLEYCTNCAAPLSPDADAAAQPRRAAATPERPSANDADQSPAFGFVRAPKWPKPEFDANTVKEEDIPKEYINRFNPRKVEPPVAQEGAPRYSAPVSPAVPDFEDEEITQRPARASRAQQPAATRPSAARPSATRQAAAPASPFASKRQPTRPAKEEVYDEEPVDEFEENYDEEIDDAEDVNYAPPMDDDDYYDEELEPKKRGKLTGKNRNIIFFAAAAALVVIIIVFGVIFINKNYGSFGTFFSTVFGGNPIAQPATVEASTDANGSPAYIIYVYSRPNYTVRFTAGTFVKEVPVDANGNLPLRIPVHLWIPDEPLEEAQISVTPDLVLIAPDGKETKLELEEPIVIDVPTLDLNVTAPTTEEMTVDAPDVSIVGSVLDNTVMIFVDDVQIGVDEAGNFSSNYTLPGSGTYTLTVEARKNGCQTARKSFTLNYAGGEAVPTDPAAGDGATTPVVTGNVDIAFNEDVTRRATSSTMTVSGTMDPAATITVTGAELAGDVTAADGKFSFAVKTDEVGMYPVTVTATKDNSASSKTIYLEHNPDKDSYISGAHKLDYDRIVTEPNHKQGYKVIGKVVEIIQTEPYVIAKITTSSGDIIFSYYSGISSVATDDGKTYNLYADPAGKDEATGLPHMYVWFILKDS